MTLVGDATLANVEAGVNRVVKVAEMFNVILTSPKATLNNGLICPGLWSESDALAPETILLLDDSDLCLLGSVP